MRVWRAWEIDWNVNVLHNQIPISNVCRPHPRPRSRGSRHPRLWVSVRQLHEELLRGAAVLPEVGHEGRASGALDLIVLPPVPLPDEGERQLEVDRPEEHEALDAAVVRLDQLARPLAEEYHSRSHGMISYYNILYYVILYHTTSYHIILYHIIPSASPRGRPRAASSTTPRTEGPRSSLATKSLCLGGRRDRGNRVRIR